MSTEAAEGEPPIPGPRPAPAPSAKPASLSPGWEKFKAFVPLLQAGIAAFAAYKLSGQITNAIQTRQLELSNVKEMRDVVLRLVTSDNSAETVEADVIVLTVFREYAISPLISFLDSARPYSLDKATLGLCRIGSTDSVRVREAMINVLGIHQRIHAFQTHQAAIRVLAILGGPDEAAALKSYERGIFGGADSLQRLQDRASEGTDLDLENLKSLRNELEAAFSRLRERGVTS